MRVLFATPECAPLTKTGGLGDVSAALPAALRAQGIDVRVLMPRYQGIALEGKESAPLRMLGADVRFIEAGDYLLVHCPALYERSGDPYQDAEGADWPDNALRFGVLSRAAALLASRASPLDWKPEVVHCNDWQTALAPVYLHFEQARAGAVMTVHNLAFQGLYEAALLERLELPRATFAIEGLEFYGRLSFLKGGIIYADAITTVSPSYAREIQTEEQGCGLDGVLRERAERLRGILNGIDTHVWNPMSDARIAERYSWTSLDKKGANKAALQRRMNLAEDAARPLLGVVCRFTQQKGIDLLAGAAEDLVRLGAQLCVLGRGEREHEAALAALAARHPDAISVAIGFNEDLAHLIEAGADMFLMPSQYEPCGLNQIYSLRYGTVPVVRATGGLDDTIEEGTGFKFREYSAEALLGAVRAATQAYGDAEGWRQMMLRGMAKDFSWKTSAAAYSALYRRLLGG